MFEVGKRFLRIHEYAQNPCWKKGDIGVLKQINGKSGRFESERTGELYWGYFIHFDPTPIDDTPAPRMVTTCDIGARVVRGRDWDYDENEYQGGKNPIGTITEYLAGLKLVMVEWDNGRSNSYEIGDGGKYDLYYADEQPKKEAALNQELPDIGICKDCGREVYGIHFCVPKGIADAFKKASSAMIDLAKSVETETKDDDGTDKTQPDPAPGIASIMFGSKPRLMYGSLMQIQGPTKDEQARNARTEEERKRYEQD